CNTPFIHIQGGKYDFIIDHQGDVDSTMYIKDRDRIVGEYTLPADELITAVHLEPGFDIYSMKVIFTYPGSGNVTIKNLKIHSEGPFYTDTIFLYICLIISLFALGLWAYKTGFFEKDDNDKEKLLMLLVFGLLMFVSYPLFWDRFVARTDMGYHLARIENTRNELLAGHFPMSIYFLMNRKMGYSATMYPWLFFVIPGLVRMLGVSTIKAYQFFIFVINAATMGSSWYCGKRLTGRRDAAFIMMALYTLLPYREQMLWYRFSIGELLALAFMPLLIASLYDIILGDRRKWPVLTIAMTGFINSHILSIVFAAIIAFIFVVIFAVRVITEKRYVEIVKAAVMTVLLNVWYLVPFLFYYTSGLGFEANMTSIDFSRSAIFPAQLFMMFAGKGIHSTNKVAMGIYNENSLSIGWSGLILLALAVYFLIFMKKKDKKDKFITVLSLIGIMFLFMSTTWFPWKSLQKIEPLKRAISIFQFPIRFKQIAETCICVAGILAIFKNEFLKKYMKQISLVILACSVLYAAYTSDTLLRSNEVLKDSFGEQIDEGDYGDYVPTGYDYKLLKKGNRSTAEINDYTVWLDKVTFNYNTDKDADADLQRIYYKGYEAYLSDGTSLNVSKGDGGSVRVLLPKGSGSVTLVYREPGYFKIAYLVSLISLIGWAAFFIITKKRRGQSE
nr:hypothetical protein [Lachnospiraceae bacterium]